MVRYRILASKRLSRSFHRVNPGENTWESIPFEKKEVEEIIAGAVRRIKPESDPLTITISPIEKLNNDT